MATNVTKQTSLTFAAKLEVIVRVESGEKSSVIEGFGILRSLLSMLLKTKGDVRAKAKQSELSGARCVRKAAFEDGEKSLHKWFADARGWNISVSEPMLQQKAKNFALTLITANFVASSRWL